MSSVAALISRRRYEAMNPTYHAVTSKARRDSYVRACADAVVFGPFSNVEDHIIITWNGRLVDLAIALGRTYNTVDHRRKYLIKQGFIAPKITKVEGLPTVSEIRAQLSENDSH